MGAKARRRMVVIEAALVLGLVASVGLAPVAPATAEVASSAPSAALGVAASAGNGKVDLTWQFTPDSGQPITGFRLYRYTGSATTSDQFIPTSADARSLPYGELVNGTSYRFAVAAVDATGVGPQSPLTSPVTPLVVTPFTDVDALVKAQFSDFLGRPPASAELLTWRAKGNDGTRRAADLVTAVASSKASTTPSAPITRLYSAYFKRLPDFSGFTYWVAKLRAGTSLARASNTFAASSEFQRAYGSLSNPAFVSLVYRNVLGRAPDPGGASYWVGRLDRKVVSKGQVMLAFSESSENIRKKEATVDSVLVRAAMLRRMPTSPELAADVANIDGAGGLVDLVAGVLGSAEYLARFGTIVPGPAHFVPLAGTGFGSVVADSKAKYAYVSDPATDRVEIIDLANRTLAGSVPVGDHPMGLDLSADGTRLYVANRGSATISEVDTSSRTVARSIALPTFDSLPLQPTDVAWASGGRLIVANDTASNLNPPILRIDLATRASKKVGASLGEATVASCPSRTSVAVAGFDNMQIYRTVTDAELPDGSRVRTHTVACGGGADGDLALADGTSVFDPSGTRVGTVFAPEGFSTGPVAADPTRAVGYRTERNDSATKVEVLDLDHMRVTQSIPLPEQTGDIADGQITVAGDGSTVLVLTRHGLAILDAPDELAPAPAPPVAAPGSPLVPMVGRVTDVEIGPAGTTAWATNLDLNQVEVFDLATRTRVATIPVGAQPNAITFSADGAKAYVVGPGSALMTVIDVATRTELRRVPVAAPGYGHQLPVDIGATSDGQLHIAADGALEGGGSVFRVDAATEAFVPGSRINGQVEELAVAVSRDRSRALLVTDSYNGKARWYSAATHALDPTVVDGEPFESMSVDGSGTHLFSGVKAFDQDLHPACAAVASGDGAFRGVVRSDGLQAYRLEGTSVERISMLDCSILGTTPSGDVASTVSGNWDSARPGAIATTDDGATVIAATVNGLTIVHPTS